MKVLYVMFKGDCGISDIHYAHYIQSVSSLQPFYRVDSIKRAVVHFFHKCYIEKLN